ncbi:MAG: DNA integrity scanning diadenylate cyclase DisA [Acidimicrobiia bacterium]
MSPRPEARVDALHAALADVAPGTPLREGLDRIVRAKMGALVVVGDGGDVLAICSGGFLLDAPFSPQRLSELAKMDGAIILAADSTRIARANVHMVPDPSIPTSETGTRHRTAERVARHLGTVPVISVSEEMSVLTVYVGTAKHVLQEIPRLLEKAGQALQTLGRYKDRLDEALASLSALEVEDLVTLRDVALVLQRSETVRRIADEIETMIVELGVDARLLRLQLDELYGDTGQDLALVMRDYLADDPRRVIRDGVAGLSRLTDEELLDVRTVAAILRLPGGGADLDQSAQPRGYRLLAELPRMNTDAVDALIARYGSLPKVLRATAADLATVLNLDTERAQALKDGLARLTETSILDQYG